METVSVADLSDSNHADAIVYLLNEYAKDEMGGAAELSDYAKNNLISELQKRPHAFVVLAFVHNEPAGLAICIEGFSSFACRPLVNVHDMVVVSKFRGRGLSQKILAQVESEARARHCCKLTLEVLEGNNIAQQAYRAFGFEGYQLVSSMGEARFWQKKLM